jgi:hypothetical protein
MTKPEITGTRSIQFSQWVRTELPDSSTGFIASDIDWVFQNWRTKKIMIVETKTRNKQLPTWQRIMYEELDRWIRKGCEGYTYLGWHVIVFENTWFDDGNVYLDGVLSSEKNIKEFLSLVDKKNEP